MYRASFSSEAALSAMITTLDFGSSIAAARPGSELITVLRQNQVGPQVAQPEKADRQNLFAIPGSVEARSLWPRFGPDEDQ